MHLNPIWGSGGPLAYMGHSLTEYVSDRESTQINSTENAAEPLDVNESAHEFMNPPCISLS
jgi:hypothetical protein